MRLRVKLTPKASRDAIEGLESDASGHAWLRVRVTAPPEKGKANTALIRLLAAASGLAPGRFTVVRGARERRKTLHVTGESAELAAALRRTLG